ncbi:MAG: hypothetical protein QNK37_23560 [Acidobacteriota bacterium]|nr:hypothetical protein [Acidobacteriota bacterium]
MLRLFLFSIITGGLFCSADDGLMGNKFNLALGSFLVDFDTKMRADSPELGIGSEIDFETDLEMDKSATDFKFDGTWRFRPRQKLGFGWVQFNRTTSVFRLDRDIQFGERLFDFDSETGATTEQRIIKASYQYIFRKKENAEYRASIGVSALRNRLSLFYNAVVEGPREIRDFSDDVTRSLNIPVPLAGFHGTWRVAPKWYLRGDAEYFYIDYQQYEGSYTDIKGDLFYAMKRWGFGLGYNYVDFDMDVENRFTDRLLEFSGFLRYSFGGTQLYVAFSF